MNKPLNRDLSAEVAKKIKPPTRHSFERAYQAALLTPDSFYVQGFLVLNKKPFVPIEHGWIELEEWVIDPTIPRSKPVDAYYFPAQHFSRKELKAAVEEAVEDYPEDDPLPVYEAVAYEYYGEVMLGGKAYQKAYEDAIAKCNELKQQKAS